jgi:superfamily I DNA/RNA helicase
MSKLVPSPFQIDIFDFIKNGSGNAVINAVAGSGKTTTIIGSLKFIPEDKSVIFLAFNKSIVTEIQQKVPPNVVVKTFHSLGASAIYKAYKTKAVLDDNKMFEYINNLLPRWSLIDKTKIDGDYKIRIKKIIDLARLSMCLEPDILKDLCYKHGIDTLNQEVERALKIITDSANDISKFDFTDMIYWPAKYNHFQLEKYDFIFVDECQDLNKTQHKLIEKLCHQNSRIIAVGDKNQAIYAFAGADSESFDNLTKMPNTKLLPLSVNYRCGSKIINLAKNFVNQIIAHDNAPEGFININASINDIQDNDMVLCRNTAPLVKLCLEFLHSSKKAYVKGTDIGEDLIRLIVKSSTKTTTELKKWLDYELKKLIYQLKKQYPYLDDTEIKAHNSLVIFHEKWLLITTIITNENITLCENLILKIRQVFLNNSTGICLSTIHKAKGLESNRVFIIDKEKTLPSKFAKLPWQKEQEKNLEYVAYTRAKHYLGFVTDWSFFKDDK